MSNVQRTSLALRDPEAVEHQLSSALPGVRFGRNDPERFAMRLESTDAPGFQLVDLHFPMSGVARTESADLTVIRITGSRFAAETGRNTIDVARPFLAPAAGLTATWEAHRSTMFTLDRARLERMAAVASGRESVSVRGTATAPRTAELGDHWDATIRGVRETLRTAPDALDSPVLAATALHRLSATFLRVFSTNWEHEAPSSPRVGSTIVQRAIDYMQAHVAEPITVTDVAAAMFVSTRSLHVSFVAELGEPPARVLRRLRLDGVRRELLACDPRTNVAVIARRWGFAHQPRFAERYRAAFGENPSQTLRR